MFAYTEIIYSILKRFSTILWLSIVYVIGMLLNTFGAVKVWGNHTTHA